MNLALPALFSFILVLPGFVCVASYYTLGSSKLRSSPFGVKTALALSVAFALHVVWLGIIEELPPHKSVDYDLVLAVLSGQGLEYLQGKIDLELLVDVALYFASMFVAAFFLGAALRGGMIATNVDRLNITERLRFTSDFAYLAQGRDFTNNSSHISRWMRFKQNLRASDYEYVGVEIFTEIAGRLAYYTGILSRVDYADSGDPSRVYITSAVATEVDSLNELAPELPAIEQTSNYYVFKTTDIKIIGFYYFDDEDEEGRREDT